MISPDASYQLVNQALNEVRKLPGYEWLRETGKTILYDGRTGEPFDHPVLIGRQYMLKLNQLVLHKINARSGLGGPYAAVTQQPVGGKANHGGQRMGEMEVWAIQAFGASHLLNEMMTIKADDIQGRHQAYADIVQGNNISPPSRTAAFDGLCCEIRGLGMEMTLGKVVDTFEVIEDKSCTQQPTSLEEHFLVSSVDKLEDNGVKILEIPAGDYVPISRPPALPIIASLANGNGGFRPRSELSQEPLIDDIPIDDITDDAIANSDTSVMQRTQSLLDAFIDANTQDILVEQYPAFGREIIESREEQSSIRAEEEASKTSDVSTEMHHQLDRVAEDSSCIPQLSLSAANAKAELSAIEASEPGAGKDFTDFPSLSELQFLAAELIKLHQSAPAPARSISSTDEQSGDANKYISSDQEYDN